jgi:hypothetical protein
LINNLTSSTKVSLSTASEPHAIEKVWCTNFARYGNTCWYSFENSKGFGYSFSLSALTLMHVETSPLEEIVVDDKCLYWRDVHHWRWYSSLNLNCYIKIFHDQIFARKIFENKTAPRPDVSLQNFNLPCPEALKSHPAPFRPLVYTLKRQETTSTYDRKKDRSSYRLARALTIGWFLILSKRFDFPRK